MTLQYQSKEDLEKFVCSRWNEINAYLKEELEGLPVPFYSSVDIRESKNKYAPVDLNLYPAGFNNLCQLDLDASLNHFEMAINKISTDAKKVGIIVESHTKNLFYLDHLAHLGQTLKAAGYEVSFCSLDETLFTDEDDKISLLSQSKFEIEILLLELKDQKLAYRDQNFDLLIMNNDQSNPIDINWDNLKTPIHPSPKAGWFRRKKTSHFEKYQEVITKFSEKFSIDPNLLMANFIAKDGIDFLSKEGLDELGSSVDNLLERIPKGSKVFVKADQGTYGMGISVVESGEEIISMNRKKRNKMDIGKNKIKFNSVIIQEGVDSILTYDGHPAEVTIYLISGCPIGGFVRANEKKGSGDNLNSQGMVFKKYCISEIKENTDHQSKEAVYSIIARLSTLAGALEIKEIINN
jgi:glutamate--cysteine ligase